MEVLPTDGRPVKAMMKSSLAFSRAEWRKRLSSSCRPSTGRITDDEEGVDECEEQKRYVGMGI